MSIDSFVCHLFKHMLKRIMNISGGTEDYLMDVIERKGYSTGNVYSCKVFVEDLVDELQCDVKVSFEDHPDGIPSKLKRLREVSVFSDKDAPNPITGLSFDEHSAFMFEDIRVRCIVSFE